MQSTRDIILIAASIMLAVSAGCGSGKTTAELKAIEADRPLGPFEGTAGEFKTTDSGLKYRITRAGKGDRPTAEDAVKVHYVGKFVDGDEFDSSYKRQNPVTFPLQFVVPGWIEGLQLVAEGGQIDLIVPSKLGYGSDGRGNIPGDATLYFTVELLEVMEPPGDPKKAAGKTNSTAKLKAYEAEHPLGPFEGTEGEFSATASGLKYRIVREGKGDPPTAADSVKVHYAGQLADGTEFDSSYKRKVPIDFPLADVVAGWTEGLQLVKPGGKIDLIIPSTLGYGPKGKGPIPGDATLYFTVELLEVSQPSAAP